MYFSIAVILAVCLPMFFIAISNNDNKSPYAIILRAMLATLTVLILFLAIINYIGDPLGKHFMNIAGEASKIMAGDKNITEQLGMGNFDYGEREQLFLDIYQGINILAPAFYVIFVSIMSYISYIVLYKIRKMSSSKLPVLSAVKYFTWPSDMMIGFFALIIISLLLGTNEAISELAVYQNLLQIFRAAFILQGISVYLFYAYTKRFPAAFKGIVLALLLVMGIGRTILFIMGLVDYVFGIRAKMLLKT
ncbi:MAG: DUF2232 domain-containing protein [Eubacteriales bacterium]|nr:DUF2232 domain-containing protein [Eubacteriales bacterium]MDD4566260.1 DUF2232 domain-containing protein [Eubacteriales bacterium]